MAKEQIPQSYLQLLWQWLLVIILVFFLLKVFNITTNQLPGSPAITDRNTEFSQVIHLSPGRISTSLTFQTLTAKTIQGKLILFLPFQ
jgi:hypothetical protein